MDPAQEYYSKIEGAKKACENNGKIREDRIQEWALLDICSWMHRFNDHLSDMANAPKSKMRP